MDIKLKDSELNELAYSLMDLKPQIGMIVNYLDGLSLQQSQKQEWAVLHSLFNNAGMDNMRETLSVNLKELDRLASKVFELAGEN